MRGNMGLVWGLGNEEVLQSHTHQKNVPGAWSFFRMN